MFILFGFTRRPRLLATRPQVCHFCGQHAPHQLIEEAGKFTLFFIPVFTTRRRYYTICQNCGGRNDLSKAHKDALLRS